MIGKIHLKFGRSVDSAPEILDDSPITVFVGPNNSGKSKILNEIRMFCCAGNKQPNDVIIDQVELKPLDPNEIDDEIERIALKPTVKTTVPENKILVPAVGGTNNLQADVQLFKKLLSEPHFNAQTLCQWYLGPQTIMLNGAKRIALTDRQEVRNQMLPGPFSFAKLLLDEEKRSQVRRIVYDAFQQYLVVNATKSGYFSLGLAQTLPDDLRDEVSMDAKGFNFHLSTTPIEEASDGVRAFVGIITEIIAGDPNILLIDEPEAFLHPSLSFKLGKEISNIVSESGKRLFVSTHSSNFIMGCIQSFARVNIVRLTYRDDVATARILPNDELLKLMRNPLLRSIGVLSGLFYEFVVVTEGDSDRAFYQEVNERLLRNGRGIPNCLFLNAQNYQTEKEIIKPLRSMGIPVAGIVDVDVLKNGGSTWKGLLDSCNLPEIERTNSGAYRADLMKKFAASEKDMKKDGGIAVLQKDDRDAAENLFRNLAEYGLFVVPIGEVESWLSQLGANHHGNDWLIDIFEKMGEDPSCENYVLPADDDVWEFMDSIRNWFLNAKRKGIPD